MWYQKVVTIKVDQKDIELPIKYWSEGGKLDLFWLDLPEDDPKHTEYNDILCQHYEAIEIQVAKH